MTTCLARRVDHANSSYLNFWDTIISPTTIVCQHSSDYSRWIHHANCNNNNGYITLISRNGINVNIPITSSNDLWYHTTLSLQPPRQQPVIHCSSNATKHELWHQRLVYPVSKVMEAIHNHTKGIPKLCDNPFYRCPSCMSGKLCIKQLIGKQSANTTLGTTGMSKEDHHNKDNTDDLYKPNCQPGQHFHMDFGFVCGEDYDAKNKDNKTVTSKDVKRAYLIIVDQSSYYTWVYLTLSKTPPVEATKLLLNKFKSSNPHRTVRVDQGGELGKSNKFKAIVGECGFSLELTG